MNVSERCAINKKILRDIANAIRLKTGSSDKINPCDMASKILNIPNNEPSGEGAYMDPYMLNVIFGRNLADASISELVIPEGVTAIGNGAFMYCDKISSIVIPSTVTTMTSGANTFAQCTSLKEMTYLCPYNSTIYGPNSSNVTKIYVPSDYYEDYIASPSTHYLASKAIMMHDKPLTELIIEKPFSTIIRPSEKIQLKIKYNSNDSAFDRERGVSWVVDNDNVTITDSGLLCGNDEFDYNNPNITITCISNYNNDIIATLEMKIFNAEDYPKLIIYSNGIDDEYYKLSNKTSYKCTISRKTTYMTVYSPSNNYGAVTTLVPIKMDGYNIIKFRGRISDTNGELGGVFVTDDPTNKQCKANSILYTQLFTSNSEYIIDVSSLSGEYYIGFGGSNRTVTCYELTIE